MALGTEIGKESETLYARLDDISTSVMVTGNAGSTAELLRSLAGDAGELGFTEAARQALSLADRADVKSANGAMDDQALLQALGELRSTLEQGSAGPVDTPETFPAVAEPNHSPAAIAEDAELISDFLVESREHLSSIENQMLELEKNPGSKDVIHAVFRTFHTIKGLAGFLEFTAILDLAHDVETLLDLARKDKLQITSPIVDVVLESADFLRGELNRIDNYLQGGGAYVPGDNSVLRGRVAKLAAAEPQQIAVVEPQIAPAAPITTDQPAPVAEPASPAEAPVAEAAPQSASESAVSARATHPESVKSADSGSVRVETAKLDHLLEMVGEMVIAQSLIRNNPSLAATVDERLLADLGQLSRSTADIQRTTMSMRMVPIGQLFQRSARLVRDLSRKYNKRIILETSGDDTEVDKTIAEELSDPLLHMVRNSIDHGIESQEERAALGKSPDAYIRLKAYHQAGQIVVEISDDGRGLNREKIVAKAVRSGLIESGAQLPDNEVYQLIFEPGFSTSEQVSEVSGRGVGMDVVRRNVQKLRGRIEIQSEPGQGSTFLLRLPLTLAIIDGLVVAVGHSQYVVPVFAVCEMLRPTAEMLSTVQGRGEMALVRGRLLPIVRLHRRFAIEPNTSDLTKGLLVVVESVNKQFCLFVDDMIGKQEIVIKGLGRTFKDVSGLAGCAVLGDGQIGLILDMDGVYRGESR